MAKPFPPFVDGLVDLLADFGEIAVRRMFGAYAIYRDGLTFAIVDDGIAYFKVDAENRADFERAGQHPFTITLKDGRTEAMGYWTGPDDALDSPSRLRPWAQLAWGAALRAAEKKAAKGSRGSRQQAAPRPAKPPTAARVPRRRSSS